MEPLFDVTDRWLIHILLAHAVIPLIPLLVCFYDFWERYFPCAVHEHMELVKYCFAAKKVLKIAVCYHDLPRGTKDRVRYGTFGLLLINLVWAYFLTWKCANFALLLWE